MFSFITMEEPPTDLHRGQTERCDSVYHAPSPSFAVDLRATSEGRSNSTRVADSHGDERHSSQFSDL